MPGAETLWVAVIKQTVEDLRQHHSPTESLRGRIRLYSAQEWLQSSDSGIGSLVWICDALGLEPQWVRRLALGAIAPSSLTTSDIVSEVKSFL